MIFWKVMDHINIEMEIDLREFLRIIKKVTVFTITIIMKNMRENGEIIKKTDLENTFIMMVLFMMVIGKMMLITDKVL